MDSFEIRRVPDMFFGCGAEKKCGQLLKEIGGTRVLIHHPGEPFVIPLIERIKNYITDAGLTWVELGGVVPNPLLSTVYQGIDLCRKENVDCILAVGGGSVIDSAKGIAMGVLYEGDVWDLYREVTTPKAALPVGIITTFAGSGSDFSKASVVTNAELELKRTVDNMVIRPKFSILNPELTYSMPRMQTAAGAADIMSHLCENYFTETSQPGLSHSMLAAGMRVVMKNAPIAISEQEDYDARSQLLIMSSVALSGFMRLGVMGDWGCHTIQHEMSTEWDIAHGTGLAIITPYWMEYVYKRDISLFAKFAVDVFDIKYDFENPERTVKDGINSLRNYFRGLGLPTTISEFYQGEITDETLRKMANRITYYGDPNGTTIGDAFPVNAEDVYNIYKAAL